MKKNIKGFTLIELLIVIAVLGILAVAVLSAINPIEQINRSRDTGSRSDAEQLLGAIDRYYAVNGFYPWQVDRDAAEAQLHQIVDASWTDSVTSVLSKLSSGGTAELKQSFITRISDTNYNALYVYNRGTEGDTTYVCFEPKSGAFDTEADTRCSTGLPEDLVDNEANICTSPHVAGSPSWSCLP